MTELQFITHSYCFGAGIFLCASYLALDAMRQGPRIVLSLILTCVWPVAFVFGGLLLLIGMARHEKDVNEC